MISFTKDPDAELDYTIDWSSWLPAGDTVAAATWTIPAGLTAPAAASFTDTTATVWLGGGTIDNYYQVKCAIETAQGRVQVRRFQLFVGVE